METKATPLPLQLPRTATLLVIEDCDGLREHFKLLLEASGTFSEVRTAENGFDGFRKLRQAPVDLVLCDMRMPICDGLSFLRLLAGDEMLKGIPVVMLTGSDDTESKVLALDAGASDYVTKPAHPAELMARIAVHLKLKLMRDELVAKTAELERASRTDPLTGVPNRRHLVNVLRDEHARAARYRRNLGALMVDIDHFKRLNDEYGHAAGDHALVAVAQLLARSLRNPDHLARYGGEEFAVLLPETSLAESELVAERLRAAVAAEVIEYRGNRLAVTVSIGVAAHPAEPLEDSAALLAVADRCLYLAKAGGRNRVVGLAPQVLVPVPGLPRPRAISTSIPC